MNMFETEMFTVSVEGEFKPINKSIQSFQTMCDDRSVVSEYQNGILLTERLEAFEMWLYRRMLRILWIEHKTNGEVLNKMKPKDHY